MTDVLYERDSVRVMDPTMGELAVGQWVRDFWAGVHRIAKIEMLQDWPFVRYTYDCGTPWRTIVAHAEPGECEGCG